MKATPGGSGSAKFQLPDLPLRQWFTRSTGVMATIRIENGRITKGLVSRDSRERSGYSGKESHRSGKDEVAPPAPADLLVHKRKE
jgi:hypothetical protein